MSVCGIKIVYKGATTDLPRNFSSKKSSIYNVVGWRPGSTYDVSSQGIEVWAGLALYYALELSHYGGSDISFNSSTQELWTNPANLESVATHEFGHAIGIDHSDVSESVMFANPYHDLEYDKTLRADDIAACVSMYGNLPIQPDFTATGTNLVVTLDASKSAINGNTVASYQWASSDGQTATGKTATLTFAKAGNYDITLTITTDKGTTYKKTASTNVGGLIQADFTLTETGGVVALDASKSTISNGHSIVAYQWTASDGQQSSGKTTTLKFSKPGTYTITLTIYDDKGITASATKSVTVTTIYSAIQPDFTYTESSGVVALDASKSLITGGLSIVSYQWTSSDGQKATGRTATLVFTKPGTYSITLTITDDKGFTNQISKPITVMAGQSATAATIPVGTRPVGLAINRDGTRLYVLNYASNDVSVISLPDNKVIATLSLQVNTAHAGIIISPDGTRVYVLNHIDGSVSVIDTATLTVKVVALGAPSPGSLLLTQDGKYIFVNISTSITAQVNQIDTSTLAVTLIPHDDMYTKGGLLSPSPMGSVLAGPVSVASSKRYTVSGADKTVVVRSGSTLVATIPLSSTPMYLIANADGSRVYVSLRDNKSVVAIDTSSNTVVATYTTGSIPSGLEISSDGSTLYVTNNADNTVSVVPTGHTVAKPVVVTSGTDCLFAWAEKNYANVLYPAGAATQQNPPYTLRYYTGSQAYLMTSSADSHLYYRGPLSGGALLDLGGTASWMATAGCK